MFGTDASAVSRPVPDATNEPVASSRSYRGESSDHRHQRRWLALVDAGIEVFGIRGFPQATMRDVCARARLSERYFYESFANMQELYKEVYASQRRGLLERLREAMSQAPPEYVAMAKAGQRAFFTFIKEDPRRVRIMLVDVKALRFTGLGQLDPAAEVYALTPYVDLFGEFLAALYPMADELDMDMQVVHQTTIGMTVQLAVAWAAAGFDKSVDDIVRHTTFVYQGFDDWVKSMVAEKARIKQSASLPAKVAGQRRAS